VSDTVGSHAWQLTFNETGGFSADSSSLVFTSAFETHNFWSNQIYRYDLNSGATTRLTRGSSYNEHPRYTLMGTCCGSPTPTTHHTAPTGGR
jgi:hypothetical protein